MQLSIYKIEKKEKKRKREITTKKKIITYENIQKSNVYEQYIIQYCTLRIATIFFAEGRLDIEELQQKSISFQLVQNKRVLNE